MSPKDVFWTKKVVIGDGERGLVYRNRQLEGVLAPGVHRWFDPMCRVDVVVHNIAKPEYAGNDSEVLIQALGVRLGDCFTLANLGTDEVGLVLKNGKLEDVLAAFRASDIEIAQGATAPELERLVHELEATRAKRIAGVTIADLLPARPLEPPPVETGEGGRRDESAPEHVENERSKRDAGTFETQ